MLSFHPNKMQKVSNFLIPKKIFPSSFSDILVPKEKCFIMAHQNAPTSVCNAVWDFIVQK